MWLTSGSAIMLHTMGSNPISPHIGEEGIIGRKGASEGAEERVFRYHNYRLHAPHLYLTRRPFLRGAPDLTRRRVRECHMHWMMTCDLQLAPLHLLLRMNGVAVIPFKVACALYTCRAVSCAIVTEAPVTLHRERSAYRAGPVRGQSRTQAIREKNVFRRALMGFHHVANWRVGGKPAHNAPSFSYTSLFGTINIQILSCLDSF